MASRTFAGALEGRLVAVTGAARGIGREHNPAGCTPAPWLAWSWPGIADLA